jgi:hypothetical protein
MIFEKYRIMENWVAEQVTYVGSKLSLIYLGIFNLLFG